MLKCYITIKNEKSYVFKRKIIKQIKNVWLTDKTEDANFLNILYVQLVSYQQKIQRYSE